MLDPQYIPSFDDVSQILRRQGIKIKPELILWEEYIDLIQFALNLNAKKIYQENIKPLEIDLTDDLDSLSDFLEIWDDNDLSRSLHNAEDEPIIALVNKIILKAAHNNVNEIYIEPLQDSIRIRFRDYFLYSAFPALPKRIAPAIASRFKALANLDIAKNSIFQKPMNC